MSASGGRFGYGPQLVAHGPLACEDLRYRADGLGPEGSGEYTRRRPYRPLAEDREGSEGMMETWRGVGDRGRCREGPLGFGGLQGSGFVRGGSTGARARCRGGMGCRDFVARGRHPVGSSELSATEKGQRVA